MWFLSRYDGEVSEPLVGRQGSRVSMRVARASASLLSSHGRGIWPRDVLKNLLHLQAVGSQVMHMNIREIEPVSDIRGPDGTLFYSY